MAAWPLAGLTHVKVARYPPCILLAQIASRSAMEWQRIRKRPEDYVGANLQDYEEYAKRFAWSQARALLDGLPGGGLNIAHEAIDRHVLAGRGEQAGAALDRSRRPSSRLQLFGATAPQRTGLPTSWCSAGWPKGDRVFSLARPRARTLHRRSRHTQERQRLLAIVLGVRAGTDQSPHDDRQCQGACYL